MTDDPKAWTNRERVEHYFDRATTPLEEGEEAWPAEVRQTLQGDAQLHALLAVADAITGLTAVVKAAVGDGAASIGKAGPDPDLRERIVADLAETKRPYEYVSHPMRPLTYQDGLHDAYQDAMSIVRDVR